MQSSSLRQTHAYDTGSGPASSFLRRGPAGSRTWVAMYSTPAVECVRLLVVMQLWKTKRDRRSCDQRIYGALPLSYGPAWINSWAGGTRTHDTRLLKHVLRIGSRSCALVTSVSSSNSSAIASTPCGQCEVAWFLGAMRPLISAGDGCLESAWRQIAKRGVKSRCVVVIDEPSEFF